MATKKAAKKVTKKAVVKKVVTKKKVTKKKVVLSTCTACNGRGLETSFNLCRNCAGSGRV